MSNPKYGPGPRTLAETEQALKTDRAIAALPSLVKAAQSLLEETPKGEWPEVPDTISLYITVGKIRALRAALKEAGVS